MSTPKRIYEVTHKPTGETRLVRAATKPQAIHHVSRGTHDAKVASQDRLVDLVSNGVKVEDATEAQD